MKSLFPLPLKNKDVRGENMNETEHNKNNDQVSVLLGCGGNGYVKDNEQTNEEWFDTLSTEEKAEFIATQCFWSYCAGFRGKLETKYASGEYWDKWLKEKHEE